MSLINEGNVSQQTVSEDSRRREELAANPDSAEAAAEALLDPAGAGAARREACAANPDTEEETAARTLEPNGRGAARAEALAANPDTAAEEAELLREAQRRRPPV
jgi:hypothetical protein